MFFRRKTAGLMLAAAAVGLATAAALPASAGASATSYYKIFVQVGTFAPPMCLQPANTAGGAGTSIVQQTCVNNSQAQNWAPINIGGSSYQYLNQATGMCIDVRGKGSLHAAIDQWPCNTISNERWYWPHSLPDGMFPIVSQVGGSSGYCLDVPGASTQAGLAVQLYTCNGTAAQAWGIVGPVS